MVTTDGSTSGWPKDRALACAVAELLDAGQYESLAELLDRARAACDQQGDTIPAHTLDLARRICLACSQSRAETEWLHQASEEAAKREDGLRQQLSILLDLGGEWDQNALVPGLPQPAEPPSLRQRLQGILRRRPDSHLPESMAFTAPAQPVDVPASPPPEPEDKAAPVVAHEAERPSEPGPPSLVIHCLGPFRVYNNLKLIEKWPGLKCKLVFKYLLFHRRTPIHREALVELFWPDTELEAACRNLYQAVYSLRQALKSEGDAFAYVLCEDNCYELNPALDLWIDSEEFLSHYQNGRKRERSGQKHTATSEYELAESLYEGEFLCEDRYEDWPVIERENLKHTYLDVLDRLSQFYFEESHYNMCIAFCQRILAEDNCREDIHRRLMRCFVNCEQLHLAIRQYNLCVETLNRELDVPPMSATVELYQQIRNTRVQIQSP